MAASPPSEDFKYLDPIPSKLTNVLLQLPWNNTGVAFQFHLLAGDFREARSLRSGGRYMCCYLRARAAAWSVFFE